MVPNQAATAKTHVFCLLFASSGELIRSPRGGGVGQLTLNSYLNLGPYLNSYLNLGWPPATSPSTSILKGSLPAACP